MSTELQCWVEMIQENEHLTLLYFVSLEGFRQAMKTTSGRAYPDFWKWHQQTLDNQVLDYVNSSLEYDRRDADADQITDIATARAIMEDLNK